MLFYNPRRFQIFKQKTRERYVWFAIKWKAAEEKWSEGKKNAEKINRRQSTSKETYRKDGKRKIIAKKSGETVSNRCSSRDQSNWIPSKGRLCVCRFWVGLKIRRQCWEASVLARAMRMHVDPPMRTQEDDPTAPLNRGDDPQNGKDLSSLSSSFWG